MKKFSVVFFALILALFCVACGSTTSDDDEDGADTAAGNNDSDAADSGNNEGGNGGENGETSDGDNGGENGETSDGDNGGEEGGNGGEESNGEISKIKKGEVAEGTEVTINECVVTGVEYLQDNKTHENTGIKGFYVSEIIAEAKPYSGIYVFVKNVAADLYQIGDKLEVKGTYKKYYDNPQIETTEDGITKLGTADLPKPAEVAAKDIATPFEKDEEAVTDNCKEGWTSTQQHGAEAGKYEGVLVKVTDVEIIETNICHGAFTVTDDLAVYKNLHYYSGKREAGKKFKSIQGILMYSYDAYELAPTKAEDFVEDGNGGGNGGDEGGNGDSDEIVTATIAKVQGSTNDDEKTLVEIKNVVVISPVIEYPYGDATKYSFYVSEEDNTKDYSGLYVYKVSSDTAIEKGDKVTIQGLASKFSGQWEVSGVDNADSVVKTGKGTVPAAVKKAYADLKDTDRGTYIEITDELTVKEVDEKFNNVTFSNNLLIMPLENKDTVKYTLDVDDKCTVKGIYDVSHNKKAIIIIDANDIVKK